MYKFFITLLTVGALAFAARAQDVLTNSAPRTEIETFEAQTNTVIVKGMGLINTINMSSGSISVLSKQSMDVTTGRKEYGLMIEFVVNGDWQTRAVVDYSELDSFLNGIDYLNKVTSDVTPLASFEAVYTTKSGFSVIAYSARKQGNVHISIQFDGWPRMPLSSDQVSQFRDLVSSAKNSLDALMSNK
jgi:hypothetical protein